MWWYDRDAPYPRGTYSYLSIARTTYLVKWWYDRDAPYPRGTYSYLSIARTTYLVVWWYDRAHRTPAAPTRT